MSQPLCEVELWVVLDENGDYAVGTTGEDAGQAFEDTVGFSQEVGTRRVKVTLKVPLPKPIELTGAVKVTEEAGELQAV